MIISNGLLIARISKNDAISDDMILEKSIEHSVET